MKLINCTPHPVKVKTDWGEVELEPSGIVPRVSTREEEAPSISISSIPSLFNIPCVRQKLGEVQGLPDEAEDTLLIVSRMVFEASPHRNDLVVPDTGRTCIRDSKDRIIAVTRFVRR